MADSAENSKKEPFNCPICWEEFDAKDLEEA